jgi:hypothetical protein
VCPSALSSLLQPPCITCVCVCVCDHDYSHGRLQIPTVIAATSPIAAVINVMGCYHMWWSQRLAYEGEHALWHSASRL